MVFLTQLSGKRVEIFMIPSAGIGNLLNLRIDMNDTPFTGSARYVLDQELAKIVNISMVLEMPLLLIWRGCLIY